MRLKKNLIQCLCCNDIIESVYTHDYKTCRCGAVSIDGGLEYPKRSFPSGAPEEWFKELSDYEA
ncbi:hypothetical protein L1N85_17125 [Paenibacillus alkaliterrae]|uniref:DUF7695 domain-containing protein n=1 Tax=Paenibacillus alkaliterrae TaxID=320909 RepID=UPI001F3FF1CA|nr:hypothetical protein [Paenibacillus alkaliterrae]MCF2940130.1 hypothetical protein [Paenibacillus alkaliterrae]